MIFNASLLDWESKRDLGTVLETHDRQRCAIYKSAYAHLVNDGPAYAGYDGILDAKVRETQRSVRSARWWEDTPIVEDMKLFFKMYLEYIENQRVILREIEKDAATGLPYSVGKGRGKAVYGYYKTRFDDRYATDTLKKLEMIKFTHGTLLTLTVDPKRFANICDATRALNEGWNRLHRSLDRRFGKISYLRVVEFGKDHNLPHLHILIENVHFSKEKGDLEWLRELWSKTVGTFVNVRVIRDQNAGRYVMKYLKKTFTGDGSSLLEGNAWCYWITNAKFHSESLDVKDRMLSAAELRERYIRELVKWDYDTVVDLTVPGRYEYIGTMSVDELGEPPPEVISDKWLEEKGWLYSEEHLCWFYSGIGDHN